MSGEYLLSSWLFVRVGGAFGGRTRAYKVNVGDTDIYESDQRKYEKRRAQVDILREGMRVDS